MFTNEVLAAFVSASNRDGDSKLRTKNRTDKVGAHSLFEIIP
jgi:hypothetical protein